MSDIKYCVKLDSDKPTIVCLTKKEVFELLKQNNAVDILSYNEADTSEAYNEKAISCNLSPDEIEKTPVYVSSIVSLSGSFVTSVEEWIDEQMLDEFYYPDNFPYIETVVEHEEGDLM